MKANVFKDNDLKLEALTKPSETLKKRNSSQIENQSGFQQFNIQTISANVALILTKWP